MRREREVMIAGIDWTGGGGRTVCVCVSERRPSERVKNRFCRKGRVFHFCFHRYGGGGMRIRGGAEEKWPTVPWTKQKAIK